MAAASVALNTARTLLNDDAATLWTDSVLLPKLQEAHRELQVKLQLNGLPVFREQSSVLLVDAGTTDLTGIIGYPTNLIEPITMKERAPGQTDRDFIDMQEVDFIPSLDKIERLIYWCWRTEKVLLLGATIDREVLLRYTGGVNVPATGADSIGFIGGELYLGSRTAAIAASSVGNSGAHDELTTEADKKLDMLVRMNQKGQQNLPARRRPYGRLRSIGWYV